MKSKGILKLSLAAAAASAIGICGSTALASDIAQIEGQANNSAASLSSDPVVTVVGSTPGTMVDGYTYTSWQYFVQDSSGALDMFYSSSLATGYTPTVGTTITASGNYSPFDDVPAIHRSSANPISVSLAGTASVPVLPVVTISQINVGTAPGPYGVG